MDRSQVDDGRPLGIADGCEMAYRDGVGIAGMFRLVSTFRNPVKSFPFSFFFFIVFLVHIMMCCT